MKPESVTDFTKMTAAQLNNAIDYWEEHARAFELMAQNAKGTRAQESARMKASAAWFRRDLAMKALQRVQD